MVLWTDRRMLPAGLSKGFRACGSKRRPNPGHEDTKKMKILVVEDDPIARKLLEKLITRAGHECLQVENGKQAWELFRQDQCRIVISDWIMPEMDGLELCHRIRHMKAPNYTYLVLLTGKESKENTIKGFEAGIDDYIVKPVNAEEVIARLRAAQRIIDLEDEHRKTQSWLLQSEKMASIGQLAAGVAHEINNPTGFVSSNLKTLLDYQKDIGELTKAYGQLVQELNEAPSAEGLPQAIKKKAASISALEQELDIQYILADARDLVGECAEGMRRIKKIVMDLKDFAHPGENELQIVDINNGIESTLNVVWNELKYKATVKKEYGDIPPVECYAQQLNQVFMNLLVNAAQAIKKQGDITISTHTEDGYVRIDIGDNGSGIPEENLARVFDPFFTTKEVGKGTGLGLHMAYNIVQKHAGTIQAKSTVGEGTTFTIRIPATQKQTGK